MNFDLNKPKAVDSLGSKSTMLSRKRGFKKIPKISVSASLKRIKEAAGKWKDTLWRQKMIDLLKPVELT